MGSNGLHPGAVWKKCDFQIHTPRDPDWPGPESLPGGSERNDKARIKWAKDLVRECRKKQLDCIAITDHHDMSFISYVREAIEQEDLTDAIWLFPGIEVTCDDDVQCIVLLDCDATAAQMNRVMSALKAIPSPDSDAAKIPQATPCGHNINEFVEHLSSIAELRNRYIVLPNAAGHKNILSSRNHMRFKNLRVVGVYLDTDYSQLKERQLTILHGLDRQWGTWRKGILPTSDARNLSDIGKNECWVRLGEPTVEALRQALLVDRARICYKFPEKPSVSINKLEVRSSLTPNGLEASLNDGLTAIIGGRGSGKSAILEFLRFGIGRSSIDVDAKSESQDRRTRLIYDTLAEGYVSVHVSRSGVAEVWRRSLERPGTIEVRRGEKTEEITVAEAQDRIRARGYAQKELSTLARDDLTAAEQITGLVAAEHQQAEDAIRESIRSKKTEISTLVNSLQQAIRDDAKVNRLKARIADIESRINSLSKELDKKGLSRSDQELLNNLPKYDELQEELGEWITYFEEFNEEIAAIEVDDFGPYKFTIPSFARDFPEIGRVDKEVAEFNKKVQGHLAKLKEEGDRARSRVVKQKKEFEKRHQGVRTSAMEVREREKALESTLGKKRSLERELTTTKKELRNVERKRSEISRVVASIWSNVDALHEYVSEWTKLLTESAAEAERLGDQLISARVDERKQPTEIMDALLRIGERCNITDLENKLVERVAEVMESDWKMELRQLGESFLRVFEHRTRNEESSEHYSAEHIDDVLQDSYLQRLTERQRLRLCENLAGEKLAAILGAIARPYVKFQYKDEGLIDFGQASPGQQASALLGILLNQQAGPLLIDQPEDDLDNAVIMKLVRTLQKTKSNRQLIFATHNPNFVVNGDADKVLALASSNGSGERGSGARVRVKVDGALETRKVTACIADTMEGGARAFELRRRKYAIDAE